MSLITDILQYGTGSHTTSSEAANAIGTDFFSNGVVGVIANTSGVAPMTGAFAANAQGTPDMTIAITSGVAYVTGTPTSQGSQRLRVKLTANQNVTISANSTGGTRYDWVYISLDATNMANPNAAADNVATLVTSRSTSSTTDNGTPPTYGYCIAVVTVANGASSITNGNIADKRVRAAHTQGLTDTNGNRLLGASATASAVNYLQVANATTGNPPTISVDASSADTNVNLKLTGKGTGGAIMVNPYKFYMYRSAAQSTGAGAGNTKINYDTKTGSGFDTGGNCDVVTNHRFTAPVAGFYWFSMRASISIGGTVRSMPMIYKNGVEALRGVDSLQGAGATPGGVVSGILQLAANDYIEGYIYDNAGGNAIEVGAAINYLCGFLVSV